MDDAEVAAHLADRLREAHRRVAALALAVDEKASITRRLLAISDASKHDVPRASRRLETLLAELDSSASTPSE